MPDSIFDSMRRWQLGQEMDLEMAQGVAEDFDQLMEGRFKNIDDLLRENRLNNAFVSLSTLTSFINSAIFRLPSITDKLENWIGRIEVSANSIAEQFNASSFSISVGFPLGISIGLSFPVDKGTLRVRDTRW